MGLKHGDENFMDQFYLWNCIGNPTMNFSKPKWTLNFLDFWQNKELNVTRKYHKYQTIPIKLVVFIINVYKAFVIVDINDSSNNFLSNSYVESKLCVFGFMMKQPQLMFASCQTLLSPDLNLTSKWPKWSLKVHRGGNLVSRFSLMAKSSPLYNPSIKLVQKLTPVN